ncbi:MAG TPA: SRPBCC domain-containing protein [Terracidiphilus sp.]|jgi:uncharacterized protein YndB with AHSA1/START domain|nr:SRPBCC domain-containing protein [Terracidiphilus sp.]
MSAGILASFQSQTIPPLSTLSSCIDVSVSVRAERQRLYQMLTVAEYMEAWLAIPGLKSDSSLTVTSTPDSFRIDHFRSRALEFTIAGRYRACRRSKLQLVWQKQNTHDISTSHVLIRLRGDFERTVVSVTHRWLPSKAEEHWHRDFWERSLDRLQLLF